MVKKTLRVGIGNVSLNTPLIMVSGIFSYGEINIEYVDYKKLGAIITKTVSLDPMEGNPQPRIWEASAGMLNCIGLQNPGIEKFMSEKLPQAGKEGIPVILSITGRSAYEISAITEILSEAPGYDALELNLSCPNVDRSHLMVAQSPEMTFKFVEAAKMHCKKTLIAKLSPNVTDIKEIAAAAENGGADALSLINTVRGLAVDIENRRIIEGGLSGPAIKPLGLRAVYDVYRKVSIPIIGLGGIVSGSDALEYMLAGASAVGIGSGFFSNPFLIDEIYLAMYKFIEKQGFNNISEITGLLNEKE